MWEFNGTFWCLVDSMKIYEMICLIKLMEFLILKIRKKKQDNRELMIHTKKKMECILFQFQNQLIIKEIRETNSIYNKLIAKRLYIG